MIIDMSGVGWVIAGASMLAFALVMLSVVISDRR